MPIEWDIGLGVEDIMPEDPAVEGAMVVGAIFSLDGLGGAMLPGDWPGWVTWAAFGAPVGAGLGEDEEEDDIGEAIGDMPPDEEGAGAILPGDWPGWVTWAAFGAPVGAGDDVCAQAKPVETIKAAEASMRERMEISLRILK